MAGRVQLRGDPAEGDPLSAQPDDLGSKPA
jgi:hypothetical protein